MNNTCRIVILNGVGSVGKSSVARALQGIAAEQFLHVCMDTFMDMLPAAYADHPDGFIYETNHENGRPVVEIKTGSIGERLLSGMRHAIAAMAAQGLNLIVDDVVEERAAADYARLLSPFEAHWVGVFAPLDVLETRERERGDRMIGLARWQFDRVHKNINYDLKVDTSTATPMECARLIKDRWQL